MQVDFLRCDVGALGLQSRLHADTVIMNPPFGTRRKGADMEFLRAAFQVSIGVCKKPGCRDPFAGTHCLPIS